MKLKHFRRTGHLNIPHYTYKKYRMQGPTECYKIWLEDSDGYIQVDASTLYITELAHIWELTGIMEKLGYSSIYRIVQEDGEVLWG
jgi:hypothetical protein